jgi:hypothetical protein
MNKPSHAFLTPHFNPSVFAMRSDAVFYIYIQINVKLTIDSLSAREHNQNCARLKHSTEDNMHPFKIMICGPNNSITLILIFLISF